MEVKAKALHYNVIERELALIKQKYQLASTNLLKSINPITFESRSPDLKANKENLNRASQATSNSKPEIALKALDCTFSTQKIPTIKKSIEGSAHSRKNQIIIDEADQQATNDRLDLDFLSQPKQRPSLTKRSFDKMQRYNRTSGSKASRNETVLKSNENENVSVDDGLVLTKKVKFDEKFIV